MTVAIIDYGSGNLRSAEKAFQRMSVETTGEDIVVSSDAEVVRKADRIVLPGVGAFADCRRGLDAAEGMVEVLEDRAHKGGVPFLGVCVGMQLMARKGLEYEEIEGLSWINGEVRRIEPSDLTFKVPHMGWNDLVLEGAHPVLDGLKTGDHAYFVHSYQMEMAAPGERLAYCDYGGAVTAIVGRDTMIGTQFHPEKSQAAGLRLIANWLSWRP